MRRLTVLLRLAGRLLALGGLTVAAALIAVMIGLNTPMGRQAVERKLPSLTGGMVTVEGISGKVPWRFRLAHLQLHDAQGVWLAVDQARLAWSPLSLLGLNVRIASLTADRLSLARLPVSSAAAPPEKKEKTASFSLPLRVALSRLHIGRLEIGGPILGAPAVFAVDGHAVIPTIAPLLNGVTMRTLPSIDLALEIARLDRPGALSFQLRSPAHQLMARLHYQEEKEGLVTQLGRMPELAPIRMDVFVEGPREAATLNAALNAGPAALSLTGKANLYNGRGDLALKAQAPALTLRPEVSWEGIDLQATLKGALTAPLGRARLEARGLTIGPAGLERIEAEFTGQEGKRPQDALMTLRATLDGLRLPGKEPSLLAAAPLTLTLTAHPLESSRPFALKADHDLLHLAVRGQAKPGLSAHLALDLPRLAPLASLGGVAAEGHAGIVSEVVLPSDRHPDLTLALSSHIAVTGGQPALRHLIGPDGRITMRLSKHPDGLVELSQLDVSGQHFQAHGMSRVDLPHQTVKQAEFSADVPDLRQIDPILRGDGRLTVQARGAFDDLAGGMELDGALGIVRPGSSLRQGPIRLKAAMEHLPEHPQGTLTVQGKLDGAELGVNAALSSDREGGKRIDLNALSWKNVTGQAHLSLGPKGGIPLGDVEIASPDLRVFRPLVGQNLAGHLALSVHTMPGRAVSQHAASGQPALRQTVPGKAPSEKAAAQHSMSARSRTDRTRAGRSGTQSEPPDEAGPTASDEATSLRLKLEGALAMAQAKIGAFHLDGTIRDAAANPTPDLVLTASGLKFREMSGHVNARLRGPQNDLALVLNGAFQNVGGSPAALDTALRADLPGKALRLTRLNALLKGERLRLEKPVRLTFGEEMGVDRLRISATLGGAVTPAVLDVAGTVKPQLSLQARLDHVTPALARPFLPNLQAQGDLAMQARLKGTLADPTGKVTVILRGLRLRSGAAASLPALALTGRADLAGHQAQIDTRLNAGPRLAVALRGKAPLSQNGKFALTLDAKTDLALFNGIIGVSGMSAGGQLTAALGLGGTMEQPRLNGRIGLDNASFDDYAQGVRLKDIHAVLLAQGDRLEIRQFLAHAGAGTMALEGTVGIFRPGLPIDVTLTARKAQPLMNDLLAETINASLHLHGQVKTRLDVDGSIDIPEASITLPDSMPASVPQLEIIHPGEKLEKTSALIIGLGLDVVSPGRLFVRGHGIFAEMQGRLHIGGTSTAPDITGGFDLRRGSFNLAGISLNFSHGHVGFDGSGVTHRLDPTLDFRADRNADGVLASLLVNGYASAPKLDFVSTPNLSRDQILSILLFGADRASLSATQLASLGAAVVQLAGGSSFDPLETVRNSLGLDHLSVGGGSSVGNGGTTLEAGKYVAKGVYVGAREGLSGAGTQVQVRVDLTKHLKVNTTVGTGGQVTGFTTPENDPGSSVGLSYGTDY